MVHKRIVIDTDPGIDDAVALLLALASPGLEIAAITAVAGNVSLTKTTKNALRLCELAGADVPVAAGAPRPLVRAQATYSDEQSVHGADGLGGVLGSEPARAPIRTHAIDLIAELASQEPLTIVGIGPLTNLALLLARHPDVTARIERFVIMGGARSEGNVTPAAEFNVWFDPEAAYRVFSSGVPVTLFPLDVTRQATLTAAELDELGGTGQIGSALAQMIGSLGREHVGNGGERAAVLHDPLTILHLLAPDAMQYVDARLTVDCGESVSRGATVIDTSRAPAAARNAKIGVSLDRGAFVRRLIDAAARLDSDRTLASR